MRGGSAEVVGGGLRPGVPFRWSRGSKAWIDWESVCEVRWKASFGGRSAER